MGIYSLSSNTPGSKGNLSGVEMRENGAAEVGFRIENLDGRNVTE